MIAIGAVNVKVWIIGESKKFGFNSDNYDYSALFKYTVRITNDPCVQALGSHKVGRMLYLGLGPSIDCAFIMDGTIVALALRHLLLRGKDSVEQCLNRATLEGNLDRWQRRVAEAAIAFKNAFLAEYVVYRRRQYQSGR